MFLQFLSFVSRLYIPYGWYILSNTMCVFTNTHQWNILFRVCVCICVCSFVSLCVIDSSIVCFVFFLLFCFVSQCFPGCWQRTLVKLCNGSNVNVWWGGYVSASLTSDSWFLRCLWVCLCAHSGRGGTQKTVELRHLSVPPGAKTHTTNIQSAAKTVARPSEWVVHKTKKCTPTETHAHQYLRKLHEQFQFH